MVVSDQLGGRGLPKERLSCHALHRGLWIPVAAASRESLCGQVPDHGAHQEHLQPHPLHVASAPCCSTWFRGMNIVGYYRAASYKGLEKLPDLTDTKAL